MLVFKSAREMRNEGMGCGHIALGVAYKKIEKTQKEHVEEVEDRKGELHTLQNSALGCLWLSGI